MSGNIISIDPVSIVITVVNVLILFLILRFLLFKPVNEVLEKRRKSILDEKEKAEEAVKNAEDKVKKYESDMQDIEKVKAEAVAESKKKANQEYERIVGDAEKRASEIISEAEAKATAEQKRKRLEAEKEIAEISLIENIQREDLNPIEEAQAYRQLIEDYSLTQEELSVRISKSKEAIANTMRLLKLHPEVQKLLAQGQLSAGHARALLGLADEADQLEAAKRVIESGLSVRQTEDLVRFFKLPQGGTSKTVKNNAVYKDLEKKMTSAMGTKVRIKQKEQGRGVVEISYFSEEQLDEIYLTINRKFNRPE